MYIGNLKNKVNMGNTNNSNSSSTTLGLLTEKSSKIIKFYPILFLFIISISVSYGQVTVTAASGGIDLTRSLAVNGSAPAYTTLGNIVITETAMNDVKQSQTNATLILTAPSNWQFNTASGNVATTAGDDITAISISVAASAVTITLTTANGTQGMNTTDQITISNIQVQAIDGNITPSAGNITRSSANAGNAVITGITEDVTNFGSLSMDPLSPMPVELISFTASPFGGDVKLNWSTATEVNNYGFEVQRSVAGAGWEATGFVQGHGNSNSTKEYEFVDDLSTLPEYQKFDVLEYRLKQIDTDGTFEFYGLTATVDLMTVTDIENEVLPVKFELYQNYPNPFNPSTKIRFELKEQADVVLTVYNVLGEEISVLLNDYLAAGLHDVEFNANNLSSGIYYYQLQVNTQDSESNFSDFRKMMLLK